MPKLQVDSSNWRTITGGLLRGVILLIGLSACASQPEQPIPASEPTIAPAGTAALELALTPVTISTVTAPAETETRLGFNVRGWT